MLNETLRFREMPLQSKRTRLSRIHGFNPVSDPKPRLGESAHARRVLVESLEVIDKNGLGQV
jgi:hypothetical protein